jgi:3-oxoacyl-[acyl-carrier protein] reductase
MDRLSGRTAIVTGGAMGVGRGIAEVLSREGATVYLADIDLHRAETAAADLSAKGGEVFALEVDVRDMESCTAMAVRAAERTGRIDILAANAGIYPLVMVDQLDDAKWDAVMDINVKGALHAIRACLPGMVSAGYGRIVLSSSITGPITGTPGFAAYGASKAALLGMMRSMALEVVTRGVTINAVMPGNVQTEGLAATSPDHQRAMLASIPMRMFADPADIGWAVRFLASPEARYITGQTLIIDGGQVLPESPDSLLGR